MFVLVFCLVFSRKGTMLAARFLRAVKMTHQQNGICFFRTHIVFLYFSMPISQFFPSMGSPDPRRHADCSRQDQHSLLVG